jgi:putative restriction endonuclease
LQRVLSRPARCRPHSPRPRPAWGPEIPNGLALCKIHHGAFDAALLGVAPDYRIAIRADVLAEIDGPMLQHGLKDMDGRRIDVPRAERLRPNKDYLAERFE